MIVPLVNLLSTFNLVTRTIALFNQAGGVAKTTLTMNLGYLLAQKQHRVLLVDLDPQASLTKFMGLVPLQLERTIQDALTVVPPAPPPIYPDIHGMDLTPANRNLSAVEMQLVNASMRDFLLKEALEHIQSDYDFILIDCPPSLGLLSYLALVAAHYVLVPIETHLKAFEGTDELLQTIVQVQRRANRNLKIAGFCPTRYDSRNSADVRTLAAIQEQLQSWGTVFPPIPRATAFVDATEERAPLAKLSSKHPAVVILEQVAEKLENLP
jgi:chromosome partitioning protein